MNLAEAESTVAVAGGMWAVFKGAPKAYRWWRKKDAQAIALGKLLHEMSPNSGLSLRDAIDRIEQNQAKTQELLTEHIKSCVTWDGLITAGLIPQQRTPGDGE